MKLLYRVRKNKTEWLGGGTPRTNLIGSAEPCILYNSIKNIHIFVNLSKKTCFSILFQMKFLKNFER